MSSELRDILKTNADITVPHAPTIIRIRSAEGRLDPLTSMVNVQYVIALSGTGVATKTIPGNATTHSLLNDLTNCQARRMRGLDVLGETYRFFHRESTGRLSSISSTFSCTP